jgi:hypothetical protein
MDLISVPKKTQLISLDSRSLSPGEYTFNLRSAESNIFLEEYKDVIGVRLVDYHIATIQGNVYTGGYVINVEIPEIPKVAQILDSDSGLIFAKIPLDRVSSVSNPETITRDQHVNRIYDTPNRYFNPIALDRITIKQTMYSGTSRDKLDLQSNAGWMMVLEITTIDHKAPEPDRLLHAIEDLTKYIKKMPTPQIVMPVEEVKKSKIKLWTIVVPILLIMGAIYWWTSRQSPPSAPSGPLDLGGPGVPRVPRPL